MKPAAPVTRMFATIVLFPECEEMTVYEVHSDGLGEQRLYMDEGIHAIRPSMGAYSLGRDNCDHHRCNKTAVDTKNT